MNKKGISPLIATVLLIGFTVVMGVLVFNWVGNLIEGTQKTTGSQVESTLKCAGVDVGTLISSDTLMITGEGSTQLCGFKYLVNGINLNEDYFDGDEGICIGYGSVSILCSGEMKIIPTIKIENNIIDCPGQVVVVKCV